MKKKKTIDYINELRFSSNQEKCTLEEELFRQYERWTQSMLLADLLNFLNCIQSNKEIIGVAQFFGKFRASSFEEYIYRLLRTKLDISKPMQVFWGEKCLICRENRQQYGIEVDIAVGKKFDGFVKPAVVIDAKVELDAARLKTALASMLLVKRLNPKTKCSLVYIRKEASDLLLKLAENWINGIFQFNHEKDDTGYFLEWLKKAIQQF